MNRSTVSIVIAFLCGALLGSMSYRRASPAFAAQRSSPPQEPVKIVHFFTGADDQTHFDEINLGSGDRVKLMPVTAAEIHRGAPGSVTKWHAAPHRQYVVTLSGYGEIEAGDGKKIELHPGSIELAEDLTGKGHITRTIGNEDRVTLWLPLADQSLPAPLPH